MNGKYTDVDIDDVISIALYDEQQLNDLQCQLFDAQAQLAEVTAERDQLRRLLPNWNNAPKGAVCAVMDENGRWSWHDGEPVPCRDMWSLGCYLGDVHFGAWKTTLQRRPETR